MDDKEIYKTSYAIDQAVAEAIRNLWMLVILGRMS